MDEAPYSKRELDKFFTDLRDSLSRIEQNQSNTQLQNERIERKLSWAQGVGTAISVVLTLIVIPAVAWLFIQVYTLQSTFDRRVNTAITNQLTDYSLIKTTK
jgi:hypothetical protein